MAPDSVATALLDGLPPMGMSDGRRSMLVTLLRLPSLQRVQTRFVAITLSSFQAFFMAMALHPDAQQKAQAELDSIWSVHRRLMRRQDRVGRSKDSEHELEVGEKERQNIGS
ncbi:hypothetical protein BD779DRAFT_1674273 [Infundibulicybe gibba]|nr:hypothetical protein BD779DRAFT_1674273 [Infundibulicybe gibba]